ncbi:hypothetical protein [Streptomyces chartreusis]|uniref:hypothetical protein n=1 Tax=Streptomyces chartreusis TaxID=1969 RepID=UPI0036372F0E
MADKGSAQDRLHGVGTRLARTVMLVLLIILVPLAVVDFLGAVLGSVEGALIFVLGGFAKD